MTTVPQQKCTDFGAEQPRLDPIAGHCGRAYCGPAHGHCWDLDPYRPPPWTVDLPGTDQPAVYRLVHAPGSQRPARDHLGNYLYVPMQHDLDPRTA